MVLELASVEPHSKNCYPHRKGSTTAVSEGRDPQRKKTAAPEEAAEAVKKEPVPEVCHTRRASQQVQKR